MYTIKSGDFTVQIENGIWSGDRELVNLAVSLDQVNKVSDHLWPDVDYKKARDLSNEIGGEILEKSPKSRKTGENFLY